MFAHCRELGESACVVGNNERGDLLFVHLLCSDRRRLKRSTVARRRRCVAWESQFECVSNPKRLSLIREIVAFGPFREFLPTGHLCSLRAFGLGYRYRWRRCARRSLRAHIAEEECLVTLLFLGYWDRTYVAPQAFANQDIKRTARQAL